MLAAVIGLAVRKGLFGGSRPWLMVGVAATGLRMFAKLARREPEVVYSETLESGHSLVISHLTRDKS